MKSTHAKINRAEATEIRLAIRATMARRGVSTAQMAAALNFSARYIDNVITDSYPLHVTKDVRARIENYFNENFWSATSNTNEDKTGD